MPNGNQNQRDMREYLDSLWNRYGRYHDHKENMAHSALVLQLTFVISVLIWEKWPLFCHLHHLWCLIGVFFVWGILYFYAGWQLRLRHYAATVNTAIGRLRWNYNFKNKEENSPCCAKFYNILHKISWFPFFLCPINPIGRGYPMGLQEQILRIERQGDFNLILLELVTFCVCIIEVIVLIKTRVLS